MLRGRGTMGGVPRNRLIRRQLALSLATLLVCLLAWAATSMLAGSGSYPLVALAGLPMLAGVPAPILLWFRGEDELDVTARWIAPLTAATVLLAVSALLGTPGAYLTASGGRATATVTAAGGRGVTTAEQEVPRHRPGHHIGAGDHAEVVRDPLGWFPPGTAAPAPGRQRLAVVTGAAGLALLAGLTALRVRRDLRRYDLTGSRRPPQRVRDAAERRRREREQRIERLRARRRSGDPAPSGAPAPP
jgi:hypothetical protein